MAIQLSGRTNRPRTMNLPNEVFGNVIVVHAPDELGRDQAEGFAAQVSRLQPRQVVLDLDGTESLDSIGLEAVLSCQRSLRDLGGDVRIATNNTVNRKILEITRLDERLEVYTSVIDAVKSFS